MLDLKGIECLREIEPMVKEDYRYAIKNVLEFSNIEEFLSYKIIDSPEFTNFKELHVFKKKNNKQEVAYKVIDGEQYVCDLPYEYRGARIAGVLNKTYDVLTVDRYLITPYGIYNYSSGEIDRLVNPMYDKYGNSSFKEISFDAKFYKTRDNMETRLGTKFKIEIPEVDMLHLSMEELTNIEDAIVKAIDNCGTVVMGYEEYSIKSLDFSNRNIPYFINKIVEFILYVKLNHMGIKEHGPFES